MNNDNKLKLDCKIEDKSYFKIVKSNDSKEMLIETFSEGIINQVFLSEEDVLKLKNFIGGNNNDN